ncbi:MAG: M3 family oligoendopeptidase [Treponema sp.]
MDKSKIKALPMVEFTKMEYKRPDIKKYEADFNALMKAFDEAKTAKECIDIIDKVEESSAMISTLSSLVYVRYSINTKDEFYKKEQDFFDEIGPLLSKYADEYRKRILNCKFRKELVEEFGQTVFDQYEIKKKTFSPAIMDDLALENKLVSEYSTLMASAELEYRGEKRNLAQMSPFMQDKDREVRKEAAKVYWSFFEKNEAEFDRIYDELVKVRTRIAQTLGFKNFVELGYARMHRVDYDANMVAKYREEIYKEVVPVCNELKERKRKRLGLDHLYYYDGGLQYKTGNAVPQGDPDWIVENAKKMYKELSPETDEFFTFMTDYKMMDLVAKQGKTGGGYCTSFPLYKSPFIFANFNRTAHDVTVITHEAGHAFQSYESRNARLLDYLWPSMEAAEIHSMSMELFTWPWMNLFFKEQTDKFKFTHLSGAITFLPYGVTVDEFQHWVYENPEATPAMRKAQWLKIEAKYTPNIDYADNDYLKRGGLWVQQGHIYKMPFYYIDYTLAQVCALQFWVKDNKDHKTAWQDYLRLCQQGGSYSFLKLLEIANLKNPFESGFLSTIIPECKKWLDAIDDTSL